MSRIAGVLQLTNKTRYGLTSRNVPMYLFSPLNNVFPQMIVASTHRDLKRNILVIAEKINDDKLPRGQIVEVVGACGDPLAERKAIHVAYSPDYWTKIPETKEPSSFFFRPVLDVPTINIDPPGCQDIDDCISIWEESGITKVAITIADVAEWVAENPWMTHAQNIGQSLYDGGVPVRSMFPKTVEHKMSLLPGERRLGYALIFSWDGYIRDPQFKEVTIINKASYTYDSCRLATEISIPLLQSICEHLAARPLIDPHDWIAELMIFYNKTMAEELVKLGKGLLRHHSMPDGEKMDKYERLGLNARMFAYAAATYEHTSPKVQHWGFQTRYCHGSSPIRRWADVVNQMAMKGMPVPNAREDCNRLQKFAKKHARDLAFMDILQRRPENTPGIVVSSTRVWVSDWSRMITCPNDILPGTPVVIRYFLDMQRATWKQRLVFHIKIDQTLV
uniref:RNB domain-containing protein n=1 Tax=viral metagenome TaxID=1070528 RepID=A0A6C0B540_9ZZZZ